MPPPSSGGLTIAQMLGVLEVKNIAQFPPTRAANGDIVMSADAIHLFTEAGRLAYADRNHYEADTDFIPLPGKGIPSLIDKTYLAQRAALVGEQ